MEFRISREDFLKEEILCDYVVTREMKEVFRAQLDILEVIIDICHRNNIKYVLCGGSLLGAIRHKGYIPWDDDVDVAMLRPEYDRFLKVAEAELKKPLFLQTPASDPRWERNYVRVMNLEQSAIRKDFAANKFYVKQGMFVDVFPIDGVEDDAKKLAQRIEWLYRWRDLQASAFRPIQNLFSKAGVKRILCKIAKNIFGVRWFWERRESILRSVPNERGGLSGIICLWANDSRTNVPTECYSDTIEVPFEYLTVSIPRQYEKVLKVQYGDWRKFVKFEHVVTGEELYFDVNKPYKSVLREKFGYTESDLRMFGED